MDKQIVKVSQNGQVRIPNRIRNQLLLRAGDKLYAYIDGDKIVLKTVSNNEQYELSSDEILVDKFVKEYRNSKRK